MLYYDRNDISEGTDLTKSNNSKEFMICHYWFFNHGLKFQDSVCNGCHDLTILSLNISDIAIIIVKNVDYCCNIHNISKSKAIDLSKILYFMIVCIYKKYYFNFQSTFAFFVLVYINR